MRHANKKSKVIITGEKEKSGALVQMMGAEKNDRHIQNWSAPKHAPRTSLGAATQGVRHPVPVPHAATTTNTSCNRGQNSAAGRRYIATGQYCCTTSSAPQSK